MENVFWERFKLACKEKNTSPTAVVRALGLSSGSPTAWKNGRRPSLPALGMIAKHLGYPMDFFYGLDDPKEKAPASEETGANEDELRFALFGGEEVSDETWEKVKTFALFAAEEERRRKERGIDD